LASFLNAQRRMGTAVEARPLLRARPQLGLKTKPHARHGSLRRILVCLDHSASSNATLKQAISVAETFDSVVTILYVLQPAREAAVLRRTDACSWEIARQEAEAYLVRVQAEAATQAAGIPVDWRLEQGLPAERIMSLAQELGADLIVLGSGGSGAATWNLGSTARQVLAGAGGSVLVAHGANPTQGGGAAAKRILVPLDGSSRAESVLPTAARIAKACDSEILLTHVVAEPLATAMLTAGDDLELARNLATRLESYARRYLENLRDQLGREGLPARAIVLRRADERQSLLDVARQEEVCLIVLSAHGNTCNQARSFGSVAAHLLDHALVPLLVLQDLRERESHSSRENAGPEIAPQLRARFTAEQP
jgi:nucleotide-binding universal stress UspA family protein